MKCLKSHTSSSFCREKTKAQNDAIKVSPIISRASAHVCIFHSQLAVQKHTQKSARIVMFSLSGHKIGLSREGQKEHGRGPVRGC